MTSLRTTQSSRALENGLSVPQSTSWQHSFPRLGLTLQWRLPQLFLFWKAAYIITARGFAKHCWNFALIFLCGQDLSDETSLQTRWRDGVSLGVWAQVMAATSISTTSQSEMAMLTGAVKSSMLLETDYSSSAYSNWCLHLLLQLVIQATVDHCGRFTSYELGWPGSVQDSRVWKNSDLWLNRNEYFQEHEYILVDKGTYLTLHLSSLNNVAVNLHATISQA